MKTLAKSAAFALLACSLNTLATANSYDDPPQQLVRFNDLELHTEAGVAKLYARIRAAAGNVCGRMIDGSPWSAQLAHRCALKAIGQAVERVNLPELTNYYFARSGKSIAVAQTGR